MMSSNENIYRVNGPLWGESTGDRWIPLTKGQWSGALLFPSISAYADTDAMSGADPIMEIRRPEDCLISAMGFPIGVNWSLYVEKMLCYFLFTINLINHQCLQY